MSDVDRLSIVSDAVVYLENYHDPIPHGHFKSGTGGTGKAFVSEEPQSVSALLGQSIWVCILPATHQTNSMT